MNQRPGGLPERRSLPGYVSSEREANTRATASRPLDHASKERALLLKRNHLPEAGDWSRVRGWWWLPRIPRALIFCSNNF